MDHHIQTINTFIHPYQEDPNVIGIFLVGSYAYGTPKPNSDIDIYIITQEGDTRTRGTTYRDNKEIEYFINPIKQVEYYLSNIQSGGQKSTAHMLTHGILLYQASPLIETLMTQAKEIWRKEIPDISATEKQLIQYTLDDLSKDLEDALIANNIIDFHLIANKFIQESIKIIFLINKKRITAIHKSQEILAIINPNCSKLINKIYQQDTLTTQYESVQILKEYIESMIGGSKPKERILTGPLTISH